MSEAELSSLHEEIAAFLQAAASPGSCAAEDEARSLWREHPVITTAEIEMLLWLAQHPARVPAIACHLGRDESSTATLLAALEAVGVVERGGDCYVVTTATKLYLLSRLNLECDEM